MENGELKSVNEIQNEKFKMKNSKIQKLRSCLIKSI